MLTIFGLPDIILSDLNTNFTAKVIKELTSLLQIKKTFTATYHPQRNGMAESRMKIIGSFLRKYVQRSQQEKGSYISLCFYSFNVSLTIKLNCHRMGSFTAENAYFQVTFTTNVKKLPLGNLSANY